MKIICFGDSNTWGYDPRGFFGGRYDQPWPELLARKLRCSVLNWGENGREIPAGSPDFPEDADLVILMLGTNDLLQGNPPETVQKRMEDFLSGLTLEKSKLFLIAPPPLEPGAWVSGPELIAVSRELAERYQALALRLGIPFADAAGWKIPLAFDGVHFTQEGHSAFAGGILDYLHKGE